MKKLQKLFVYGTLREPEVRQKIIGRQLTASQDTLSGYVKGEVVIHGNVYPIVKQAKGVSDASIKGFVIEVNNNDLKKLDAYETEAYERCEVVLQSGDSAWVYREPSSE